MLDALACRRVSGDLGRKRGRLARSLEAGATRRLPRDHVALPIGERDDGVIERSLDVGLAHGDVLANAPAPALGPLGGRAHRAALTSYPRASCPRPACASDPCGCARWSW